jgi:MFS family permease
MVITAAIYMGSSIWAPYVITLFIFTLLQLGTVYVPNFAGFCILRFLAGFAGSPPLATGGEYLRPEPTDDR